MSFHQEHHHHLLYADTNSKLSLFFHSALRAFANALVSVFLPAFILFEMSQPLWVVFAFFGIFFGIASLICIPMAKVTSRFGSKIGMVLGLLFLIPYLYCMGLLTEDPTMLWYGVIFGGIFEGLFWIPFHHDMSQVCKGKKSGQSIAFLKILMIVVTAIAPLAGGIFVDHYSAKFLLVIAAGIAAVSVIPLLLSPKDHTPANYSFKVVANRIRTNPLSKDIFIAYFGASLVWIVGSITWPLIMFTELENYTQLGLITSATTLIIIFLLHKAGKRISETRGTLLVQKIVKLEQATWAIIALTSFISIISLPLIAVLDTVRRACSSIMWTILDHTTYHESTRHKLNPVYPLFMRQFSVNISTSIYCGIFAVIFHYQNDIRLLAVSIIPMLVTIGFQRDIFDHEKKFYADFTEEVEEINVGSA